MARDPLGVIGRYPNATPGQRFYLRVRWRICPFDRLLDAVPEEGALLDVGCGSGLWLTYLGLARPGLTLEGVDPDPRKLALAASSSVDFARLHETDARDLPSGPFDCVTALDVLYLLPDTDKARVLNACYSALQPGGTLLLKELDTKPVWKSVPSRVQELISVRAIGLTHGERLYFQPVEELADMMESVGFAGVDVRRVDAGYLHPHVMVTGRRPATG